MTAEIKVHSGRLGVFTSIPNPLEDMDLKCPKCSSLTPDRWAAWAPPSAIGGSPNGNFVRGNLREVVWEDDDEQREIAVDSMTCDEPTCGLVVVRLHEMHYKVEGLGKSNLPVLGEATTVSRMLYPHSTTRPLDPLVSDPFRRDYIEASAILDISPRASALLARRLIEHLLEAFDNAQQKDWLNVKIDNFRANAAHPSPLKQNLHDVREMADTVAHPKWDNLTGEMIDVSRNDADWTLDVVDRLFDYFIISPERTRQIEAAMDEKMNRTGRKKIKRGDSSGTIGP